MALGSSDAKVSIRPDGGQVAVFGLGSEVHLHDYGVKSESIRRLVGHDRIVNRAIYSPDGHQLATVSNDLTVRVWNLHTGTELFALRLPEMLDPKYRPDDDGPADFDFRCTPDGHCWIAVPLTMGRLALYRLPYDHLPPDFTSDLNP